jgi:hypothetical protein
MENTMKLHIYKYWMDANNAVQYIAERERKEWMEDESSTGWIYMGEVEVQDRGKSNTELALDGLAREEDSLYEASMARKSEIANKRAQLLARESGQVKIVSRPNED